MNTKRIIAITTITTVAAAGNVFAQATPPPKNTHKDLIQQVMSHHRDKSDRKAITEAIIVGNYSIFKQVASTSPLANIDQTTFNLLTPQFQARKNAQDQIRGILLKAGITPPNNTHEKKGP